MCRFALAVLAGALALTLAVPARAATVATTAPFPGGDVTSGRVRCIAVNTDSKPKELTSMQLIGAGGLVLQALAGPTSVGPGASELTAYADLTTDYPVYCRFVYQGKFRASFTYYNGAEVEVIPATSK